MTRFLCVNYSASLALFIEQIVGFRPAQDETDAPHKRLCQPGMAGKAAIPDMQHFLAPDFVDVVEDLGFFRACLAGRFPARGPLMQVRQGGRAFSAGHQNL